MGGRRGSRHCPGWRLRVRRGWGHTSHGRAGAHDRNVQPGAGPARRHFPGFASRRRDLAVPGGIVAIRGGLFGAPGGSVRRPLGQQSAGHGDGSVLRGDAGAA
jgi:hypothetical protein